MSEYNAERFTAAAEPENVQPHDEAIVINDQSLLQAMGEGNDEAFIALYDRHYEAIRQKLVIWTKDGITAEDLAQDVFETLLGQSRGGKLTEFQSQDGRQSAIAWLQTVAYHRFIDHYRRKQRTVPVELHDETFGWHNRLAGDGFSPEPVSEQIIAREALGKQLADREALYTALNFIPSAQSEAIIMRYFKQYTTAETAASAGVAEATIRTRIHYGLKLLSSFVEIDMIASLTGKTNPKALWTAFSLPALTSVSTIL